MGNLLNGYDKLNTKDDYVYKDNGFFGTGKFIGVVYIEGNKIRKQFKESDSAYKWISYVRSLINNGQSEIMLKMRYTSSVSNTSKGDYVTYVYRKKKHSVYIANINMESLRVTKRFGTKKSANEWISYIRQFINTEGEDMILKLSNTY